MNLNTFNLIKNQIFTANIDFTANPWDTLDNTELSTSLGDYTVDRDETVYSVINLTDIYAVLINVLRVGGVVMIAGGLIAIMFLRNNDKMVAEQKSKIMFRLLILILAGFAVTIFNVLYSVANTYL